LTFSSFLGKQTKKEIEIEFGLKSESEPVNITSKLRCTDNNDIYAKWIDSESKNHSYEHLFNELKSINDVEITKEINNIISNIQKTFNSKSILQVDSKILDKLSEFVIYNLTTQSLRGLSSESKKQPLGINGESLDVLLNNFSKSELELLESHNNFFNWLDGIKIDKRDELKTEGYKLGKSNSKLYFTDKYMLKKNNLFSAENANEGILHVLFYLSLFISQKTPNFFAIDNIETALNPKLCRELVKHLVELSILKNKQAIITTHNPAILDGLNLNDDNQRLFEVYRNDNGATKIRRIKFKSDLSDKQYKISSMWMNGVLGAIPKNF
jgi:AAA15 family ATPase/GTPase